ncbi:MAG TPA: hypothetical protein PK668_23705 [Myxococcota bacterium]|nr:hypothetical protein [Myxococcota bacterium]HRY96443.1 hypothetical protein [Myxococcota bacterium]HSA22704.1 hypothetical protein [Myxococcota bacterium]
MRNALLGLLAVVLLSGSACATRAMTYTGIALTAVGAVGLAGGVGMTVSCHEAPESCVSGDGTAHSTVIAVWLGTGLVAAVLGLVLWISGPDVASSDASGLGDEGLTGEVGAGLAPVPSTKRPVEAAR